MRCQKIQAERHHLSGQVQGVGFRPFVYRLARDCGLSGWVQNRVGTVEILVQGPSKSLDRFSRRLESELPPLARIERHDIEATDLADYSGFEILDSTAGAERQIHLPPDLFLCADCRREMQDPSDRRYRYPFINCTQCGPRYTLIESLPYDRCNTTMAAFPLCPTCQREYEDPASRRFHAEPIACADCGPSLHWVMGEQRYSHDNDACLQACVEAFRAGKIVAVKGIGGYHLMCDASNNAAVAALRERKRRPHKPLAVMFPEPVDDPLAVVERIVFIDQKQRALLMSPARPVVLLKKRGHSRLSPLLAPGLNELGVMLPYSPLHYLLLEAFGGPLVATSANISGSPVLTDSARVEQQLTSVFDACLHHNRPIQRPADDAVYRRVAGTIRPLRLGRGKVPLEVDLPFHLQKPLIATGGHMKNTLALAWDSRAVISPHIGDMGNVASLEVFEQTIRDLTTLYQIEPQQIVCDAHPSYATTRWAERSGLPVHKVFHHAAHASSVVDLQNPGDQILVFTWDGVGYGEDGSLWGGEALLGAPGHWRRVACLRPFRLPGGERAGRELWRSAAGLCWEAGIGYQPPIADSGLLYQAWEKQMNSPLTSAAGRLFDGIAALAGYCETASFEGQGPMLMEATADENNTEAVELPLNKNTRGQWEADWQPLLEAVLALRGDRESIANLVHASLARSIAQQAGRIRDEHRVESVAFAGGVFQNDVLTSQAKTLLEQSGFTVLIPSEIPVNDAGISFGQIIEYGMKK